MYLYSVNCGIVYLIAIETVNKTEQKQNVIETHRKQCLSFFAFIVFIIITEVSNLCNWQEPDYLITIEPHHRKTNNFGFQQGPTPNGLYCNRKELKA